MADRLTVDERDVVILQLLRDDARRTRAGIAKQVGLSAPAIQRRIDRLEQLGIITGYTVVVDHAKLGRPLEAFTELRFTGSTPVEEIEGIAENVPEVEAVFTLAGDPDAVAWIRVRDVADLKRVINLLRRNSHITGTKTLMVLGRSVRN